MVAGGGKLRTTALLVVAALGLWGGRAAAQDLPPPAVLPQQAPATPSLGPPEPLAAPAEAGPGPLAPPQTPPPQGPLAGLLPPPLTEPRDPGANGWGPDPYATPFRDSPTSDFWFVNLEVQILRPFVKNALVQTVVFPDGTSHTISPPSASLHWTGAPLFEVGYRLPDALGQFSLSYRFLYASGSENLTDITGVPYSIRSSLTINFADFDYGTVPYMIYPHWFVQGRIGVRLADVYFNTRATSATDNQYDKNNFFGGGPHGRFELYRRFAFVPGLTLFGCIDGAVPVGQIYQTFTEDITNADGTISHGSIFVRKTQAVLTLIVETGLTYTPPRMANLHLSTGYHYEEWRDVGEIDNQASRGNVLTNGVFLRAVWDF